MLNEAGRPPRELNRLDIKNYIPPQPPLEEKILPALDKAWPLLDGLVVLDQVSQAGCGVVTPGVCKHLADLGTSDPTKLILADSRERIGQFRSVWLKPNLAECVHAVEEAAHGVAEDSVAALARQVDRPVFCTRGEKGILLVDPRREPARVHAVPAYPVAGPIDVVGAGDSTSAGIACAVATGASLVEAAAFGNLVASVTIQQLGTTGTATPEELRQRWREVVDMQH
jgi:bifunctional ADP-heptose synthase (sugar kinase/adenylyltransferase)